MAATSSRVRIPPSPLAALALRQDSRSAQVKNCILCTANPSLTAESDSAGTLDVLPSLAEANFGGRRPQGFAKEDTD